MINILPGAVLDERQRSIIAAVDPHAEAEGVALTVTRGHSSPLEQLAMIERKARENNCLFKEFVSENLNDQALIWRDGKQMQAYLWQQSWSALLLKGIVINPPLAAVCLEHYIRPSSEDMYMKIMYPSPHIKEVPTPDQIKRGEYTPCPIDFSARVDRGTKAERVDIKLVTEILTKAKAAGAGIRFIKPEPRNVCVHCDLEKDHEHKAHT